MNKTNKKNVARTKFRNAFTTTTVAVVLDVARGRVPTVSGPSAAAYKANLTRGTYAPFARVSAKGVIVGSAV